MLRPSSYEDLPSSRRIGELDNSLANNSAAPYDKDSFPFQSHRLTPNSVEALIGHDVRPSETRYIHGVLVGRNGKEPVLVNYNEAGVTT
mmetsp:Transcript_43908/g.133749  ORF Transcript_43908/g.133749 Transcript_43908/m.133749 type:complete len:89 (+) Transcript_43908:1053-1319(+)